MFFARSVGHPQHGTVAILQPKGVNHPPSSCQEVQQAVLCILETLVVHLDILCLNSTNVYTWYILHSRPNPLFHRDIHWPNIILSPGDSTRWFLVDWDDATMSPTHAVTHLSPDSHSPAVFEDNHGAEVDIWGVGKLILDLWLACLRQWCILVSRW